MSTAASRSDPTYLAERLGALVAVTSLNPDVAGALVKERGQDPLILANSQDGLQRQRFTIAHELGHLNVRTRYAAGREQEAEDWAYLDRRDTFSRTGIDPAERYCNAFAANLLMPAPRMRSAWAAGLRSTPELASLFDVSLLSMEIRIQHLGLAD